MQLFITNQYTLQGNQIIIHDERVLYQSSKVLRYTSGDDFSLQDKQTRYTVSIDARDKKSLQGIITDTQSQVWKLTSTTLVIAMTNKWDKIELICQKATEIGISNIIIRTSKRSVIQIISDTKLERVQTICLEAAEQSYNRIVPQISICKNIKELPKWYIAYQDGILHHTIWHNAWSPDTIIVWPEGGFEPSELQYFQDNQFPMVKLGDTIFRTETAAIIGAWWLKNTLI